MVRSRIRLPYPIVSPGRKEIQGIDERLGLVFGRANGCIVQVRPYRQAGVTRVDNE